jgi:hypothetical protein
MAFAFSTASVNDPEPEALMFVTTNVFALIDVRKSSDSRTSKKTKKVVFIFFSPKIYEI